MTSPSGRVGYDLDLLCEAVAVVAKSRRIRRDTFQRKMRVGWAKAGRLLNLLTEHAVIGPYESGPYRSVLVGSDDVDRVVATLRALDEAGAA